MTSKVRVSENPIAGVHGVMAAPFTLYPLESRP